MDHSKLFFLHIPKTAGSTFKAIIAKNLKENEILSLNEQDILNAYQSQDKRLALKNPNSLKPIKLIQGHYNFGFHEFVNVTDYKYVTFLRDPYSLTISHFFHLLRSDNPVHKKRLQDAETITEFANHSRAYNVQTRILSGVSKYQNFIANEQENFSRALSNLENSIEYIGIQESFEESVVAISHLLGWKHNQCAPANMGSNIPREIPDAAKQGIEKSNQLDRQLYDAAVEKFNRQKERIAGFPALMKAFKRTASINRHIKTPLRNIKTGLRNRLHFRRTDDGSGLV